MKRNLYLFFSLLIITSLSVAATGCNFKTSSTAADGGFFATTDFGENWQQQVLISKTEDGTRTIGNVATHKMLFDPLDDNVIYLLSSGSGIYVSYNKGQRWSTTPLSSGTYQDLAIDSRNTDVVYTTQGTKILKTVDGLKSWNEIYTETRPGQKLVSLLVDPVRSDTVYAATTKSIIKSTDYGNTWTLLDWKTPIIRTLYQSHRSSKILYALTNVGLLKSTDAGVTWQDINESLKEFSPKLSILWMNYNPDNEYIFLGTTIGIVRSLDGGETWTEIPTLFDFAKVPIVTVVYHPEKLNEVVFGVGNVLHKTIDGGNTWKTLKTVPTSRTINYLINDPVIPDNLYLGTAAVPQK